MMCLPAASLSGAIFGLNQSWIGELETLRIVIVVDATAISPVLWLTVDEFCSIADMVFIEQFVSII